MSLISSFQQRIYHISYLTYFTSKAFLFHIEWKKHSFNTDLQHWPPLLIYSGFQEGSTGWSGSFYTSFLKELKPWDYSAFELGIEVSQD